VAKVAVSKVKGVGMWRRRERSAEVVKVVKVVDVYDGERETAMKNEGGGR
jgi:hypothetical protein